MSKDEPFDQEKFDRDHPRDEQGKFASERFDSDPFIIRKEPDPERAQTELQRQVGQSAELHRIASLNYHVRQTLNKALDALRTGQGHDKVLDILHEAAPKYVRFGGALHHWTDEHLHHRKDRGEK